MWRFARFVPFVRSAAAPAPVGRRMRPGSTDTEFVSDASRAISISSLHRHRPASGGHRPIAGDGDATRFRKPLHANISTAAPRRMSSTPVPPPDDATEFASNPSASSSKSTPFLLADIGEGISEVELLQWHVKRGDAVAQFDCVCEVQSDKANVDITSRFDGIVERLCGEVGDMMSVGEPLLYIATEGDVAGVGDGELTALVIDQSNEVVLPASAMNNADDEQDRIRIPSVGAKHSGSGYRGGKNDVDNAPPETFGRPVEHQSNSMARVMTSPAVRKLGKENNIDLGTVLGTGPGGRVLKADVLKIIDAKKNAAISSTSSSTLSREATTSPATSIPSPGEDAVVPLRGYHRLMVKSMASSLGVPHMVYCDEINVDALTEVRDSLRPLAAEMGVPRLTYMPFFLKAASLAMNEYPAVNSSIDARGMTLTYRRVHDIGVAMDTARGLTVPVVRGCEGRSVLEIAAELGRLYSLAAKGTLSGEDISNPTFTLSNIGAIGGTYMSPVVLPPQVAIGAMGKIQRLPRFVSNDSDQVEAMRVMPISWGGDHRVVDGATMARFSNLWKSYCEKPSSMMFAMR